MRITFLFVLTTIMLRGAVAMAQPGAPVHTRKASPVYIRIGAGYGFTHAGRTEINGAAISGSETSSLNVYSLAVKRVSFGSGACADLAGGYMINRHVALELGVHAVVAPSKYSFSGILFNSGDRAYTSETYAQHPVYIIPAIVFSTGNRLQLYSRVGLVLPVSGQLRNVETRSGEGFGRTEEIFTTELKQRFSIGFQGALGCGYELNSHFSIWGEANVISLNPYAKQRELTASTENGVNKMANYSTYQKVTDYEFSYDATYPAQASQPAKQATFSLPFSSMGLNAGLKYVL